MSKNQKKKSRSRTFTQPFNKGAWVTPVDPSHPMYRKKAKVLSLEYAGSGRRARYFVVVIFESVPTSIRNRWRFMDDMLKVAVSHEIVERGN